MARSRRLPTRLHANLILLIEEEAHRLRLFDTRSVSTWLGVSRTSWIKWKRGSPLLPVTAGQLCDKLGIKFQVLQARSYTAPAGSMLDKAIRSASQAANAWYRWVAIVGFGKDLLVWLSRHRIDAGLSASIGGQPVRLSFRIGKSDEQADYEIIVEPTADVWTTLQQRIGCTTIPLIEGNASATLLTEIIRYVRILTAEHVRATGRQHSV